MWDLKTMKKLFTLGGNIDPLDQIKFDSSNSMVHLASKFMYQSFLLNCSNANYMQPYKFIFT